MRAPRMPLVHGEPLASDLAPAKLLEVSPDAAPRASRSKALGEGNRFSQLARKGTLTQVPADIAMADADPVTITAIVGAATGLVSLIVMALKIRLDEAQIETLQDLAKSLTNVVATYDHEVVSLRREVEALRTLAGAEEGYVPSRVDREEREIATGEREAAWRRMREIAKALGWAVPGPRAEDGESSTPTGAQ